MHRLLSRSRKVCTPPAHEMRNNATFLALIRPEYLSQLTLHVVFGYFCHLSLVSTWFGTYSTQFPVVAHVRTLGGKVSHFPKFPRKSLKLLSFLQDKTQDTQDKVTAILLISGQDKTSFWPLYSFRYSFSCMQMCDLPWSHCHNTAWHATTTYRKM